MSQLDCLDILKTYSHPTIISCCAPFGNGLWLFINKSCRVILIVKGYDLTQETQLEIFCLTQKRTKHKNAWKETGSNTVSSATNLISFFSWQTCVVRAWDTSRPLLFCPAMNTAMWQHPITAQQVAILQGFGYVEIPCIAKKLVCGDEGKTQATEILYFINVCFLMIDCGIILSNCNMCTWHFNPEGMLTSLFMKSFPPGMRKTENHFFLTFRQFKVCLYT